MRVKSAVFHSVSGDKVKPPIKPLIPKSFEARRCFGSCRDFHLEFKYLYQWILYESGWKTLQIFIVFLFSCIKKFPLSVPYTLTYL